MRILLRAVITGFGLSLGAALYKKVSKELGLGESDDADKKPAEEAAVSHVPNDSDGNGDVDPA